MIREYYEAVCAENETRANLIALRSAVKDEKEKRAFAYLLGGDFSVLCRLLEHEDPKVRKNAALLLGEMESEDLLPVLFDSYKKEKTLFVRPDYLKAIAGMDCEAFLDEMEEQLEMLRAKEPLPEEKKHVSAEMRMLQNILLKYRSPRPHVFHGYDIMEPMLLLVNREQTKAVADEDQRGYAHTFKGRDSGERRKNQDDSSDSDLFGAAVSDSDQNASGKCTGGDRKAAGRFGAYRFDDAASRRKGTVLFSDRAKRT